MKHMSSYLRDTNDPGIDYWRPAEQNVCPLLSFPGISPDSHGTSEIAHASIHCPYGFVDAD